MPQSTLRPLLPAALTLLALSLAACSPKEAPPAKPAPATPAPAPAPLRATPDITYAPQEAPALQDAEATLLMQALYPNGFAPAEPDAGALVRPDGDGGHDLMTLVSAKTMADGRTAVIVNAAPTDAEGREPPSHGTSGSLNVYVVHRQDGKWIVDTRSEALAEMGSHGHIGGVTWAQVGPGKEGFVVASGFTGQGHTIGHADIFDLGGGIRHLGTIMTLSDDSGGCHEERESCSDIAGVLRFVDGTDFKGYREIRVDFTGRHYTVTVDKEGEQHDHVREQIKQTARYRFDGKRYGLVSGANPAEGNGG